MDGTVVDLPDPSFGPAGSTGRTGPLTLDLSWQGRDYAVRLVDVGLACCSVEVMSAALANRASRERGGLAHASVGDGHGDGDGETVEVLVVSGTCTDVLAPALRRLHAALEGDPLVVSFGACSNSGGPYWDSYSVTNGVDQVIPVDVYVPGCPPPPEALLEGIATALATRRGLGAQ